MSKERHHAVSPRSAFRRETLGRLTLAARSTTGVGRSLRPDPLKQDRGGLVARVLGDELAAEGAFEDRAAQGGGAFERGGGRGGEGVDKRELALDLGDDAALVVLRRYWNR